MQANRRTFLKLTGLALTAAPFLSGLVGPSARAADPALVPESDPLAKSLKYCANADKPTAQCADRKKKEKKDQYCHNCQLYTASDKDKGKCLLISKGLVTHHGWCNSWVKRP